LRRPRQARSAQLEVAVTTIRGFDFPDELFYLLEHDAWVRLDTDGNATTGMTSLGAHISGEFIEFMAKPVGTFVDRERALGMLEMSKVIRSARSPICGVIADVNEGARADPKLINSDPYGQGWLARLRPTAWEEDTRLLVTGAAIPAAVEAYMALLSETFGEAPP
jgi:glycine cleavage system H protein